MNDALEPPGNDPPGFGGWRPQARSFEPAR
jgi:hypothetical protein